MKPLKITFFGVPRLERAGAVVDISRRKVVALMAYLAVTGQPQSRDTLAALLWPEYDQSSARANLRRDLSRLKQLLGEEYLKVDRNQAEIARQPALWLDVAAFESALLQVRQHHPAARQLCDDCAAALVEAVGLYHDDFLSGFALPDSAAFDDWQFFQREGLRQDLAEALQRLIDWHVASAEYERAVEYGRRWVALDSLHEPAQRRLMQLYAWSGQQAAALRQYQEAVRLLQDELGVEPEEETEVLYEAIRSRQLTAPKTRTGPKGDSAEGRYELLDLLAVGGHAEVYYGRDRESGTDVVIKRLKPALLVKDAAYLKRFVREATALSRLEHPNIVRMLATFEENGQHHIVIEYVPGGSLRQLLDRERPLTVEKALDIALELADALARAHHLNVIHRDLKPENVLLAADGTPRLTDFGLARLRREDVRLTRTGTVMGSPAYMSPEALRGEELDPRGDIWSFGVLLYELLAGRKPFDGQQLTPVLVSILQDEAPVVTDFRPDTPPALADLLRRTLQKERQNRPLSMRQVAAELEAIAAGATYLFASTAPASGIASPGAHDGRATASESVAIDSPAPPSQAQESRFVGRQETLARLEAQLREAVAGKASVAFVTGEAGQGKTSLLQALVRRSQEQYPDLLVAGGNCNAYTGSGDPYLPFREIMGMLTGDVETRAFSGGLSVAHVRRLQAAMPQALGVLVETGPDLLDTFVPARNVLQSAAALPDTQAPWRAQLQMLVEMHAEQRERGNLQQGDLFEQYARVLKALSKQQPLLLFLDDLQWVDHGSANLLLHLGRGLQGYPIMIVGAYRPAEVALGREGARHPLEGALYELKRVFGHISIDLSQEEGRSFVNVLLDSESNRLNDTFRETLYRQTGGHPLFTVELLRSMQERGHLVKDEQGRWVAQAELDWNTLPARVEGAIGERISRLSPALQELLEIASVEGEEFSAETVAHVLGKDERTTARQFSSELDRSHLLVRALGRRHVGAVRLSRYRFRHILIQRYLYNKMDTVEKVYQHEAVGEALEALYGSEAAVVAPLLARHFELAELPDRAAVYLQHAGDQARRAIALEEAARYYDGALAQWPGDDRDGRAAILRKIGECQWIMGELQAALATYEECYKLFESSGDLQGAGAVQRSVGRLYWEIGERERSLQYYHRSLQTLEKIPESVELAWTISSISQMHMLASQYDETISWGQRALELARRLQADEVTTHALNNLGVAYMETGQMAQGKAMVRESLEQALALGLPHEACRAYLNLGETPAGDYEERRAVLQELLTYASSIRAPLFAGSAQVELADIEWALGEWRAALARRADIVLWMERAPSIGYLRGISSALFARMYNDIGRPAKALGQLEATLPLVRKQNEVQIIGPHLGQMARALAEEDRTQEAMSILREMLEAIAQQPYVHRDSTPSLLFAVDWLAGRKPVADALQIAFQCRALLEKANPYETKPEVAASLLEADGALLLAQDKVHEGAAQLQEAANHWRELGLPYDEARALIRLAQALQQAGDRGGMQRATERAAARLKTLAAQLEREEYRDSFLKSPPLKAIADMYPASLSSFLVATGGERLVGGERQRAIDTPPEAAQGAAHNLPLQAIPLVGRQKEVAEIQTMLVGRPENRLLTVVGPGGIGKTRLAMAAAAQLVSEFKHGVFFVPLASLSSAEHIVPTLAESLGLTPHERTDPRQQLLNYLHRRQILLVIDNFEHLLQGTQLVVEILAQTENVKVIVTSRERLNLSQETLYAISGLDYPEDWTQVNTIKEETLRQYSAVDLLLQRAQTVAPGLVPQAHDLQQAARICQMVEGMPLALVLAAGWLQLLSFEEIAEELSESLAVLESSARDLPERQRSVQAAFDYSWKRLAAEDRRVFMALCVFRGGFTRQAAEVVARANLRTLRTLANKSFISANRKGRFDIHEVLRQLGRERLQESGSMGATRQAHSRYYLSVLNERKSDLYGGRQLQALKEIEIELENVRGAWHWALQQLDVARLDASLETVFLFAYMPSRYAEGIELLGIARERLAREAGESAQLTCARLAVRLAFLLAYARPEPGLIEDAEQALLQARRSGDPREIAFALLTQGCITVYAGSDPQAAIPIIEAALEKYESLGDHFYIVLAKIWLGYCHGNTTGLDNFNRYMREALQLAQATGNKVYGVNATSNLAAGAFCEGDYVAAERFSREALEVAEEMGLRLAVAHGKVQLGLVHLLNGDLDAARTMAGKGLDEAREINYATTISYAFSVLSLCRSLAGDSIEGQRLAEEALATPAPIFGRILAEWAAGVAACGVEDFQSAWQHARQSIQIAHEAGYPGMMTWALPVLAVALAERHEKERALRLLALAKSHRFSPTGWIERSALLSETKHRLLQQVGPELYEIVWQSGLDLDLEDTVRELLAGKTVPSTESAQDLATNLPAPSTPLVGRAVEIAALQELLQETPGRLVTVEGPGGIGKTRLALAVAAALAPAFDHGAFFVSLATLTAADQLPAAVAEQLSFRFYSSDEFEQQLLDFLRERKILLVLDNFEHVLEGATLVARLLQGAPGLKILVTSRERLNLSGEAVYSLQGLAYPPGEPGAAFAADAADCGAVKLLVQRVRLIMPEYIPEEDDLAAIVRICRLVQGMPLALLLAASWFSLLSLREIADEISANLDFLESDVRDLPPRQRSIRAVFEGSWKMLDTNDQGILSRLSIFRGSFDRDAAEAIAEAAPRTLLGLLQKSWLQRGKDGRFHIHELLRQYTAEKLQGDTEAWQEIQQRHASYYAKFLEGQLAHLRGPEQQSAYAAVKADFDNVLLAWHWLLERQAFDAIVNQILPALFRYSETRTESFTLLQLLDAAVTVLAGTEISGEETLRATLLTAQGAFYRHGYPVRFETFGMVVPARDDTVREAWTLALRAGGLRAAYWDAILGYIYGRLVDYEEGVRYVRQLLPALQGDQERWERAFVLQTVAALLMLQPIDNDPSRFEEAYDSLAEALSIFERVGDARERGHSLRSLGQLYRLRHDFSQAIEHWAAAQSQLEAIGEWAIAADINWQIGDAHLQMGEVQKAFPFYRRMSRAYLDLGHRRVAAMVLSKESYEAARYGDLAYARQTREEALALAQESGDLFAEAWSRWEMGELLRLNGETIAARTWFEQARALFEQFGDEAGATFYHRGLGDLALASGRYEEALREFDESLKRAQHTRHEWAMAYALAGQSLAAIKLRQTDEARRQLARGLQHARETADGGVMLRVLATAAHYFEAMGDGEQAVALAAFVAQHPIAWNESKALASELPERLTAEIKERGDGLELWATVERVMSSLNSLSPPQNSA